MKLAFDSVDKKKYFLTLGFVTLVYFVVMRYFENWLYHQMGIDVRPAELFPSFGLTFMQAEPFEVPLYLLSYLVVPLFSYFLAPYWPRIKARTVLVVLGLGMIVAGVGFFLKFHPNVILHAIQKHGIAHIFWLLVTKRMYVAYLTLILAGVFSVAYYLFGKPYIQIFSKVGVERFFKKFRWIGLLILAFLVFNPSFPVDNHHFNYFLGVVNDIYHGKGLLYETSHLYGLLDAYFLVGLFKLIPMTYPMLALIVAVAYFFFFIGIYYFLRKWLESYTFATVGTAVIVGIIYFFQTSATRSVLFFPGMSPFRWGLYIPALLAVLGFVKTGKIKFLHLALFTAAFAVFWNFDTGLYLTAAVLSTFGYFYLASGWRIKDLVKMVSFFVSYLALLFFLINVVNWIVYKAWPNWHLFLRETKYFTQGAGMYPLPPIGLYEIFFFTYLVVLVIAVYRLFFRKPIDLVLVFLGLYGVFSLIYYVGESSWQLLYVVTVPFIMIIFYAFKEFRQSNSLSQYGRLASAGFLALIIYAGLLYVFKLPVELQTRNYSGMRQTLLEVHSEDQSTYTDAQYLKEHYLAARIPIISKNDTKLLIYAGKVNYFDFYYLFTIYYRSELQRYVDEVRMHRPETVLIGKDAQRNDQVAYFLAGIQNIYKPVKSLNTVDIYQLK